MYETLHGTYLYSIIHLSEIQIIWSSWVWGGGVLFSIQSGNIICQGQPRSLQLGSKHQPRTLMSQCLRLRLPLALTSMKGTEVFGLCVTQPADETCLVL